VLAGLRSWHLLLEVRAQAIDPQHSDFLPKRYLHDLGVVNRLRSLAMPPISLLRTLEPSLRTPLGGLFENAVLLSLLEGASTQKTISTWRKGAKSTIEIDFVIDGNQMGMKIPIECKAALAVHHRHIENVAAYLQTAHQRFGVLISAAPLTMVEQNAETSILNIPVYLANLGNILRYSETNPVRVVTHPG
jgi:predicted AAA+ superfamily ATPase